MATNLFSDVPNNPLPNELITALVEASDVRVERIVSHGHSSPPGFWYDQEQDEWVIVLKGEARVAFEDRVEELRAGDYLHIPAHVKHSVAWTTPDEPTVWLAIFYKG